MAVILFHKSQNLTKTMAANDIISDDSSVQLIFSQNRCSAEDFHYFGPWNDELTICTSFNSA